MLRILEQEQLILSKSFFSSETTYFEPIRANTGKSQAADKIPTAVIPTTARADMKTRAVT